MERRIMETTFIPCGLGELPRRVVLRHITGDRMPFVVHYEIKNDDGTRSFYRGSYNEKFKDALQEFYRRAEYLLSTYWED